MVRCKFRCQSKTESETSVWNGVKSEVQMVYAYKFFAVTSGSDENKQFFASTPSGSLDITAVRSDLFVPGKEYYLDLSEA